MSLDGLLNTLKARLPELQWHFNKPGIVISNKILPRGIFRTYNTTEPSLFLEEIERDIERLSQQENSTAAHHLAKKIHEKINILVKICCYQRKKTNLSAATHFGIEFISTRQQRINHLNTEIHALQAQKKALEQVLATTADGNTRLRILSELGEAEKKLTLAQEQYAKSCGDFC